MLHTVLASEFGDLEPNPRVHLPPAFSSQFTYVGAPHIWNGDEVGMWGADDPDDRKPMLWSDLRYDDEVTHPFDRPRRPDPVAPDTTLFRAYRELIRLRKRHLRLFVDGRLNWLRTDDARGLLAYERVLGDQRAIVAFNVSDASHEVSVAADGRYLVAFPAGGVATAVDGKLDAKLPAKSARVWIRE